MEHHLADLYQVCSNYAPLAKICTVPTPCGHMLYIGLSKESMKKSSWLKPQGLEPFVWYIASPSGHLPSLFK